MKNDVILLDVPYGSKVKVVGDIHTPPASLPLQAGDVVNVLNKDGMYRVVKKDGIRTYAGLFTVVEVIE